MGRRPCCTKVGLNRGAWSSREDRILANYINVHGEGKWRELPQRAGLKRCGKSCRLRWMNYLRPDIKRGNISLEEEDLIIRLHALLGNRWSLIAGRLPGRTDNEIKNYWNTNLRKRLYSQNSTSITAGEDDSSEKSYKFQTVEEDSPQAIRAKALRCTIRVAAAAAVPQVENTLPYFCNNDGTEALGDGEENFLMHGGINIEEDDDYYFRLNIDISDLLLSESGDFIEQTESGVVESGGGLQLVEETVGMENWGEGELQSLQSFMNSEMEWMD